MTPPSGTTSVAKVCWRKVFAFGGTQKYKTAGSHALTVTITDVGGQAVTVHPLIAVDA